MLICPAALLSHPGGNVEPLENLDHKAPIDDHSDDDYGKSGAEDHLPAVTDRVPDSQSERYGAPQSGEHHHVLEISSDLDTSLDVQDG